MAYFASLNDQMVVTAVVALHDSLLTDENGYESEAVGAMYLRRAVSDVRWVQTSYNNRIRRRYAGVDMVYSEEHDAFLLPRPYPSWTLDLDQPQDWTPPVPMPNDDTHIWEWDETIGEWVGRPKPVKPPVEVLGE